MTRNPKGWKPAETFRVTRLKRNGPKPNQTTAQWMRGKAKNDLLGQAASQVDAIDHIIGDTDQ